ncbi:MAG: T9SS type A sorting domain-containing protein [Calditrichaeota bacterium]|nr:T9SS type A sorting domain-containing protein [Calditrichota bacterium]
MTLLRTAVLASLLLGLGTVVSALPEIPLAVPSNPLQQDHAPTAEWSRFLKEHPGSRILDWDRFHPAPHRALLQGVKLPGGDLVDVRDLENRLRSWLADHRELLPTGELELLYGGLHDRLWVARFRETWAGLPVFGSEVEFRVSPQGALLMLGSDAGLLDAVRGDIRGEDALLDAVRNQVSDLHPGSHIDSHGLIWLPAWQDNRWIHRAALEVEVQPLDHEHNWRAWYSTEDGELLWCYDQVRHVTLNGQVNVLAQPVSQNDSEILMPARHLALDVSGQSVFTDSLGQFTAEVQGAGPWFISGEFLGRWANVNRSDGSDAFFVWETADAQNLVMGSEAHIAERDAYVHTNIVHDFIKGLDPGFTGQDAPMGVNVNIGQTCNAFYNPGGNTINFFSAGGGCPNTAQVAGVLYHEYGHGINHRQYQQAGASQGMINGAMHEGLADVNAVFIQDVNFVSPGWSLRAVENSRHYPENITGEVHADGEIIGGAMWDLRQAIGLEPAQHLYHFARWGAPDDVDTGRAFFEYFVEVLLADDDNGDLGDQTPHWQEIDESFNAHGIGSVLTWSMSSFVLHQPPLQIPPDVELQMEASGDLPAFLADADVFLNFRQAGGEWQQLPMLSDGGDVWSVQLPGFEETPWVEVYASLVNGDQSELFSPVGGAEGAWHFAVSSQPLPLLDFESDDAGLSDAQGLWQHGTPLSGPFNAFSGENVWATGLTGNYANSSWARLDLPSLVVTRDGFSALGLMHWMLGDGSGDGGNLQMSLNGGDWQTREPRSGYDFNFSSTLPLAGEPALSGSGSAWQALAFELSDGLQVGDRLDLRFNFVSNASQNGPGWYLDDLELLGLAPLPDLDHSPLPDSEDTQAGGFEVSVTVQSQLNLLGHQLEWRVDGGEVQTLELEVGFNPEIWFTTIPGPFAEQEVEYRFNLGFEYGLNISLPESGWYGFRVGADQIPPVASFVRPPRNLIGLSGVQQLQALASDNLGLASVNLEGREAGGEWQSLGALQPDAQTTGLWHMTLEYTAANAGMHEMRLRAIDESQAALEGFSEVAEFTMGEDEALDDFETLDTAGNWNLSGEWAFQSGRTYGGSSRALGSSDDGFYDAFSAGIARFERTIDLSQASSAWLELREQWFMQSGLDFVILEVSADEGPWEELASRTGVQALWNLASLDLEPWLGSNLRLRWRMAADGSDQGLHVGYFVDEIRLVAVPLTTVEPAPAVASTWHLSEAWPNPFNPETRIRLQLDRRESLDLAVYNLLGQEVMQLAQGPLEAGEHLFRIDGESLASGVYLVRARAGSGWAETRRILLLK